MHAHLNFGNQDVAIVQQRAARHMQVLTIVSSPKKQRILKQGLTRFPSPTVLPPFSSRLSFIQHPGSSSFYPEYWEIHSFIDYLGSPCGSDICSPTQLGIVVSTVS